MAGFIKRFYICIYGMAKPPVQQIATLPPNITYLGLRYDNASKLSAEWCGFLYDQILKIARVNT